MSYKNENNNTAKYYDEVYSEVKGADIVSEEIKLIKTLVPKGGRILDVGCGTGRHLVPLMKSAYQVKGIDSSSGMLQILKKKNSKADIELQDIFKIHKKEKYDLIILMWNAFNEIATSRNDAKRLIRKLNSIKTKDGRILINIDNPRLINLPNINSVITVYKSNMLYRSDWEVQSFKRLTNTTISKEKITVFKNKKKIFDKTALIKQRWWSFGKVRDMAKGFGLRVATKRVRLNRELYMVLR